MIRKSILGGFLSEKQQVRLAVREMVKGAGSKYHLSELDAAEISSEKFH